ncbi:MAG: hypothetical protein ACREGI_02015 [Candidatus Levyibacteriota bacterium]
MKRKLHITLPTILLFAGILACTVAVGKSLADTVDTSKIINSVGVFNSANIINDSKANANSGGNTTHTQGNGNANTQTTVQTGNAGAGSSVSNCVNSTSVNGGNTCGNQSPTNTPAPTTPPATDTPIPNNGGGSGNNNSSGGGGGNSGCINNCGGSAPVQAVLGLSSTAGNDIATKSLLAFGGLCLLLGIKLRRNAANAK